MYIREHDSSIRRATGSTPSGSGSGMPTVDHAHTVAVASAGLLGLGVGGQPGALRGASLGSSNPTFSPVSGELSVPRNDDDEA